MKPFILLAATLVTLTVSFTLVAETNEVSSSSSVVKEKTIFEASPKTEALGSTSVQEVISPSVQTPKPETASPAKETSPTEILSKENVSSSGKVTTPKALDQKGKIEKLNVEERTFSVGGKDFVLSKKGRVFVDGVKKTLADVQVGNLVAVTYYARSDGINNATRIYKGFPKKKQNESGD